MLDGVTHSCSGGLTCGIVSQGKHQICGDHGPKTQQQQAVAGSNAALGSQAHRGGQHCLGHHHHGSYKGQLGLCHDLQSSRETLEW